MESSHSNTTDLPSYPTTVEMTEQSADDQNTTSENDLSWRLFPLRSMLVPPWNSTVTPGQARHFVKSPDEHRSKLFCVDVAVTDANQTSDHDTLSPDIRTFQTEASLVEYLLVLQRTLVSCKRTNAQVDNRSREAIDVDVRKSFPLPGAFVDLFSSFIRSDEPIHDWDEAMLGNDIVENCEEDLQVTRSPSAPRISESALWKICTLFNVRPSILVNYRKDPHFHIERVPSADGRNDDNLDISYRLYMPWCERYSEKRRENVLTIPQHSTGVYSRYRRSGQPVFSLYLGVQRPWIRRIWFGWNHCVTSANGFSNLRMHDHWALLDISVTDAQESLRTDEALHELVFSNSIASHLGGTVRGGAWGTLALTFSKGSSVVDSSEAKVFPLLTAEKVLNRLQEIRQTENQRYDDQVDQVSDHSRREVEEESFWIDSIAATICLMQKRNGLLLSRSTRILDQLFNVMRLRDSESLNQNSKHMARLADSQNDSSLELRRFAWDSRQDARLMKFLAEVTMVFLPITAVSTTFSMSFFAVDTTSKSILPFSSARNSWIFVVVTFLVSLSTWIFWWQRRKQLDLDDKKFQTMIEEAKKKHEDLTQ